MLSQLQQAFKGMIYESNWMDRVTQQVMSQKVDAIKAEIGYPKFFEMPDDLDKLYEHVSRADQANLTRSMYNLKKFVLTNFENT